MADNATSRRRYPRYHTSLDVTIYLAAKPLQSHITQISRGGCLIYPPLPPLPDQQLKISISLGEGLPYINCKGEVLYSFSDKGTGVAFTEISAYNQDLITSHFEQQLAAEGAGAA